MMRLKELQIEGFRGIKQPLTISLEGQMVVISGPNGAGKTSIFQAIEWCLFGQLDFSGTEFQREDAIVNDFHTNEAAQVTLTLNDGTVITRSRKKRAKTSFGGKYDSRLIVTRGGKEVGGEDAQALLDNLVTLSADEFGAVVHLRQETIRSFIQGTPAERSETIDKMIGLFHLRELISGLDPKAVDKEVGQLEQRVADIERTMIQATTLSREMVTEQEAALEKAGVLREQINEAGVLAGLEEISNRLMELATSLGVPAAAIGPLSANTARQAVNRAREAARELGEQRFGRYSQIERTIGQLTQLQSELERATKDLEALAGTDIKTLTAQRNTAAARKGELQEKLSRLNSRSSVLNQLKHRVEAAEAALEKTHTRLRGLGTVIEAEAKLKKIQSEIEAVIAAEKTEGALETLLPAAAEYLERARPDRCPVCQQVIADLQVVIQRVQQDVRASEKAQRAKELRDRWQELREAERKQDQIVKEIQETEQALTRQRKELGELKVELEKASKVPPSEPLANFVEQQLAAVAAEIASAQQGTSDADITIATVDGQLRGLREKQERLQRLRQQVTAVLGIPADTENLVPPLQDRIKQNQEQLEELKNLAEAFPALDQVIDRVEQILGVLEARERLVRLEQKYPTAVKEKEALQRAIGKLNELKLGLQDIYQAATEHQRSVVGGALTTLQPVINACYSRIMGHPEYAELQIEPEEEKKGIYRYWIAARNPAGTHSTYVITRFSTSQRNVAAVAIFLAMADYLPHNLDVLMIDDPTQSMDPEHRQAMAQFLAEKAKERQVVIATEDPAFAEMILQASEKPLHYALKPWTTEGVTVHLQ